MRTRDGCLLDYVELPKVKWGSAHETVVRQTLTNGTVVLSIRAYGQGIIVEQLDNNGRHVGELIAIPDRVGY